MIYPNPDSEDAAIEQPTIGLFEELGWETRNCYHERVGDGSELGRQSFDDVVLVHRLRAALEKLNPDAAPHSRLKLFDHNRSGTFSGG